MQGEVSSALNIDWIQRNVIYQCFFVFKIAAGLRCGLTRERQDLHCSEVQMATASHPESKSEVKERLNWAAVVILADRTLSVASAIVIVTAIGLLFPRG